MSIKFDFLYEITFCVIVFHLQVWLFQYKSGF